MSQVQFSGPWSQGSGSQSRGSQVSGSQFKIFGSQDLLSRVLGTGFQVQILDYAI